MGLDTSAHPFDINLLQERITPFILENAPIDDLIEQGVKASLARWRAKEWGLSLLDYEKRVFDQQNKILKPERNAYFKAYDKHKKANNGLLSKFAFWRSKTEFDHPYPACAEVPGFNSDIHIWGRPFFISADSPMDVISALDQYLDAAQTGPQAVDAEAMRSLEHIEKQRLIRPTNVRDDLWTYIQNAPPVTSIGRKIDGDPPTADSLRQALKAETELWRRAAHSENKDELIDGEGFSGCITIGDLRYALPFEIVKFMSLLTPSWMSRGRGFASNLLELVGSKERVFETPIAPFKPLADAVPEMKEMFHDTIPENFSLGGYVPPENVGRLIELLDTHRTEMILAFDKESADEISPDELAYLSGDWQKIREAAEYAHEKGMGYLEGAEIYSGPLGMMN